MIQILPYDYYIEILHWNIFLTFGKTDVLIESKTYWNQKTIYF